MCLSPLVCNDRHSSNPSEQCSSFSLSNQCINPLCKDLHNVNPHAPPKAPPCRDFERQYKHGVQVQAQAQARALFQQASTFVLSPGRVERGALGLDLLSVIPLAVCYLPLCLRDVFLRALRERLARYLSRKALYRTLSYAQCIRCT